MVKMKSIPLFLGVITFIQILSPIRRTVNCSPVSPDDDELVELDNSSDDGRIQKRTYLNPYGLPTNWKDEAQYRLYWNVDPKKAPLGTWKEPGSLETYASTQQGQGEWQEFLEAQQKIYKEWRKRSEISRTYPFCVDGRLRHGSNDTDEDLHRFREIFESNLQDELPIISNEKGTPIIKNWVRVTPDASKPYKYYYVEEGAFVKSIKFQHIYSPDPPDSPDRRERNNPDGIGRLNQWMHIIVESRVPLSGLYIQAMQGPVGVPFGEFRTDFSCTSDQTITEDTPVDELNPDQHLPWSERRFHTVVPCKYRPKYGARHPNVFAYGGQGKGSRALRDDITGKRIFKKRKSFRVHFNWDDSRCGINERMQFIILAVKSFEVIEKEIFITPAFEQLMDSGDGTPYPYHPMWKHKMKCTGDLVDPSTDPNYRLKFDPKMSLYPIFYHYKYDRCIENDEELEPPNLCPPGIFRCSNNEADIRPEYGGFMKRDHPTQKAENDRIELAKYYTALDDCNPRHCNDPEWTEPVLRSYREGEPDDPEAEGPSDWDERFMEDIVVNAQNKIFRHSKAFHAYMMVLAWMVLMAIGTFTARFCKETAAIQYDGSSAYLGIGKWLWGHIGLFYLAMTAMWIGIVEVAHFYYKETDCDLYLKIAATIPGANGTDLKQLCSQRHNAINGHKGLGIISAILFHVSFITGWYRPWTNSGRNLLIYAHVYLGYIGKIVAIVSVFVLLSSEAICEEIIFETALLEIISVIIFVCGTILVIVEDKRLGITRKTFPIPEALEAVEKVAKSFNPSRGDEMGKPTSKPSAKKFCSKKNPTGWARPVLLMASIILHTLIFMLVIFSYMKIYKQSTAEQEGNVGACHVFQGLFSSCEAPNLATEVAIAKHEAKIYRDNNPTTITPAPQKT